MHSELSWRWRCRKIGLAFREVVALQAHLHVRGLLSWKAHTTVKLAIIPLGITRTTTRRIKRRLINNNNSLDIIIIIIIINQPSLKSNRLLLERNYWLWWVFKSHSFSQLPSTITENSCGKNSIRPIIILAPGSESECTRNEDAHFILLMPNTLTSSKKCTQVLLLRPPHFQV